MASFVINSLQVQRVASEAARVQRSQVRLVCGEQVKVRVRKGTGKGRLPPARRVMQTH